VTSGRLTIDDRTKGVTGCGRRATYVQACERPGGIDRECTWVLNSAKKSKEDEE
jgi:hypothetical protein